MIRSRIETERLVIFLVFVFILCSLNKFQTILLRYKHIHTFRQNTRSSLSILLQIVMKCITIAKLLITSVCESISPKTNTSTLCDCLYYIPVLLIMYAWMIRIPSN